MRAYRRQVAVLGALHELAEDELATAFRCGMASLAQVAGDPAAIPFEGVVPAQLLASVRVALSHGLLEDLEFLSAPAAASALYALASALPPLEPERRELGRRVLAHLQQGDASTFIALATALALGTTRAFSGPGMRARLGLVLSLPVRAGRSADPLAFALVSRRELAMRFLVEPANSDLPGRRMAARLLERAARYAALRAQQGDDCELALFEAPHVQATFTQLLFDREPLVFRHVACARGLLSAHVAKLAEEIERDLMAVHSPSRARRGATSLAARLAVRPREALGRARELLKGPAFARDPGVAAALIQGLPRALEVEPEAAQELLLTAVERGGLLALEALLDLRRELHDASYCPSATDVARAQMHPDGESATPDEGSQAELAGLLHEQLARPLAAHGAALPELVLGALELAAEHGTPSALGTAREAVKLARHEVERLALLDTGQGRRARREMGRLLQELEQGLLESSTLFDLLSAAGSAPEAIEAAGELTGVLTALLRTLSAQEKSPHRGDTVPYLPLRMRRLRLLLHLLDTDFRASEELVSRVREEQLAAVRVLCERVAHDSSSAMDRIVHAALARGVDALVRGEALELADVVLCLASSVPLPAGLLTLAEGCLLSDLRRALRALFGLMQALEGPLPSHVASARARPFVIAMSELAHAIPSDDSPRTEALRRALLALSRALEAMLAARSIRELVRSRRALTLLEGALIELAYLTRGARRRLGLAESGVIVDESPIAGFARVLESVAAQGTLQELGTTLEWLDRELVRTLPLPLARGISHVLEAAREWPLEALDPASEPLESASTETCPLPSWMPASRRLGSFFVVRPLGAGLASSVYLVKRIEERTDRAAHGLALKVPRYDASAARVLSERAFEDAFVRELPALLSVPPHEHLASCVGIVTDRAPKPYLVMEWVEGPTLARVRKRKLDAARVLDGVLAGLEQLHAAGLGHLDLTPSHVVLRLRGGELMPVLVDFGLAGRHVRPGCGHAAYAAPELWTRAATTPMAMDVYAVGCLAYELTTGRPLFDDDESERGVAAAHASHDGAPEGVRELARDPRTARFAAWITLCLRRDPEQRASATELRRALRSSMAQSSD